MGDRKLDSLDCHLITLLQANAREPVTSLALKVGMSRNAVKERLNRLEQDGIISGYTVRLGRPVASPTIRAYMLIYLGGAYCERVLPDIRRIPEIKLSQSLSGEIDMIAYIEGESMEVINRVRDDVERITGVRKVVTCPVLVDRFDRRTEDRGIAADPRNGAEPRDPALEIPDRESPGAPG